MTCVTPPSEPSSHTAPSAAATTRVLGLGRPCGSTQGIGRIQDIDGLARDPALQDDVTAGLRRKDHGMQAPALVDHQVFHPTCGVGQERPDELCRGAPWSHLVQAPTPIAPRPHGAVRRHRHRQKPRRPRPRNTLRDPLAHLMQAVAVCKDERLTVCAQRPHRQGVQFGARGCRERLLHLTPRRRHTLHRARLGPGHLHRRQGKGRRRRPHAQRLGWPRHQQTRRHNLDQRPLAADRTDPQTHHARAHAAEPPGGAIHPRVLRHCHRVEGAFDLQKRDAALVRGDHDGLRRDGQGSDGGLLKGGPQSVLQGGRGGKGARGVLTRGSRGLGRRQRRRWGEQGLQPVAVFRDHGLLVEGQQVIDGLAFDLGD